MKARKRKPAGPPPQQTGRTQRVPHSEPSISQPVLDDLVKEYLRVSRQLRVREASDDDLRQHASTLTTLLDRFMPAPPNGQKGVR